MYVQSDERRSIIKDIAAALPNLSKFNWWDGSTATLLREADGTVKLQVEMMVPVVEDVKVEQAEV